MLNTLFQKIKRFTPFLPILLIICVAGLLISIAIPPPVQIVRVWEGNPNLRGFDFENYVVHLGGHVEYAPNVLLSPDEFEAWVNDHANELSFGWASYHPTATSRIRIYVEDGKWHTFTRYAAEFSRRIYVNGEWLLDIGTPGETPETDIPNTGRITFTAQGVDGVIEIIQQSSNHVHHGTSGAHLWWYVGTGTLLSDWARAEQYQTAIILGSFLMLALFFFVLFFTHGRNSANLLFSLFCLVWLVRMGVTGNRLFTVIFPCMDWFMKFRIEYISIPVSAFLTLAIVNLLFNGMLHKKFLYGFYGVSGVLAVLFIFLDTVTMSHMLPIMLWMYLGAAVWLFVSLVWYRKKMNTGHIIFIAGLMLFIVAVLADSGLIVRLFHMPPFHTAGVAMLVFALCEAVAVFAESNTRHLKEAAQRQRLSDENAALESLSRMKTEYLANISHETQTPLTIISTSFQLISTLLTDAKAEDGEWKISADDRNLINDAVKDAQESILRAKRITQSNLRLASMQESREKMTVINISNLIINGAAIRKGLAEKRGNRLNINVPENLPQVFGNVDNLTQVLDNLLTNANNHTKGGDITVAASADDKMITVTVTDSGAGIPTDIRPHVFQRGISGSGGTGIGLALCKNMIDTHGGDIFLESEQGKGTEVTFTLPVYNEGGAVDA